MKYNIGTGKGFTLMELMVVITIVAILVAIAAPSYGRHIRRAETEKVARGFESALDIALQNAKVSGRSIKVCATDDINGTTPACISTMAKFTNFQNPSQNKTNLGWIVFLDINDDDTVTAATATEPAEQVYKRIPFAPSKVRMSWAWSTSATSSTPIITVQPRNTTGQTGTMCIYAPHGSYTTPTTNCNDDTDTLDTKVSEIKIRLSGLGQVTFMKS